MLWLISGWNWLIDFLYVESNIEQVLATTPHETPTIRPLASHPKAIQVRRTRRAGHCWRSKDEFISDVLLWTPTYGQAKAGRPARTYIQQLCEDTGCNPEDLLEAMNNREEWRERVSDIRAGGATWWWWWFNWFPSTVVPLSGHHQRVVILQKYNTAFYLY